MKRSWFRMSIIIFILAPLLLISLLLSGYQARAEKERLPKDATQEKMEIQVPPPPLNDDTFPCSMCHSEMEINPERRNLEEFHDDIVFKHDEKNRWCLDCHDAENRDMLHTAGGQLIDFRESYKLCGQCHGPELRDWKAGIHGRRTGNWNGQKEYLLCAHCHNPHSPQFPRMKPEPSPQKPGPKK